jgi:hypothetical protein
VTDAPHGTAAHRPLVTSTSARRAHGGDGNGNGHGLLREGAANPNIGPFTPELGVRRRCDRKGGKVDSFALAALSQFPLAPLSQNATANAGPRPGGATPTSTKPQCRFRSSGEPRTLGEFFARFASAQVRLSKYCGLLLSIRPPTRYRNTRLFPQPSGRVAAAI